MTFGNPPDDGSQILLMKYKLKILLSYRMITHCLSRGLHVKPLVYVDDITLTGVLKL